MLHRVAGPLFFAAAALCAGLWAGQVGADQGSGGQPGTFRPAAAVIGKPDDGPKQTAQGSKQDRSDEEVDISVTTEGGLEVATYDGAFSFALGGRLMVDLALFNEDKVKLGDGTELRRARIDLEGTMFQDWGYELAVDFAGGDADVKDAYIAYQGWWPHRFQVGQFKEPFSLEELTSSKYITFMERALPNTFAPGRGIGLGGQTYGDSWTVAGGVFGESFDDDPGSEGDEGWGVTTRATYAPIATDTQALHIGGAFSYREPDDADEFRFRQRPESHLTDVRFVNTGTLDNVNHVRRYGAELAGVWGPVSLQGEYIYAEIDRRRGREDADLYGWYVQGSWFVTGESRAYKAKKGSFGKVKPIQKYGAVELALRYSMLDLTDRPVRGGEESNLTLGVNWYINPNMRVMANYILVDNDRNANDDGDVAGGDDPQIFQVRMQIHF